MSHLPDWLHHQLASALGLEVVAATAVGGGCINETRRVDLADGSTAFVKWNAGLAPAVFRAEAVALAALRVTGQVRVPEPLAHSEEEDGTGAGWIVMEFIEHGNPTPDFMSRLGNGLAEIHRDEGAVYGWPEDNWIGSLEQSNSETHGWLDFWRERRIRPLLDCAADAGLLNPDQSPWPEALTALDTVLPNSPGHSLLHGDLWSGNVFADRTGGPVLVDPAIYRGDGVVDLAMAHLFGGFGQEFFDAYLREVARPAPSPQLIAAYQLYPLLVHTILFGGSYAGAATRAASTLLS